MIITDEVRCWFDAVLWGRRLLKFGIGRKLFWAGLKKQKTKLICTIENCGVFLLFFLFCSFTCWRLDGSAHLFHLLFIHVLCHGHFFSDFFFFTISQFLSSLILCTPKKGRDKRTELRDGEEFGRGRGADLELAVCHKVREQAENRAREAEWSCAERVLKLRGDSEERNWLTRTEGAK